GLVRPSSKKLSLFLTTPSVAQKDAPGCFAVCGRRPGTLSLDSARAYAALDLRQLCSAGPAVWAALPYLDRIPWLFCLFVSRETFINSKELSTCITWEITKLP
ncbi:MAG: hypothetical protein ACI4XB_04375, partial [Ruminococcus sp.]